VVFNPSPGFKHTTIIEKVISVNPKNLLKRKYPAVIRQQSDVVVIAAFKEENKICSVSRNDHRRPEDLLFPVFNPCQDTRQKKHMGSAEIIAYPCIFRNEVTTGINNKGKHVEFKVKSMFLIVPNAAFVKQKAKTDYRSRL
jgi:hypothetical protein